MAFNGKDLLAPAIQHSFKSANAIQGVSPNAILCHSISWVSFSIPRKGRKRCIKFNDAHSTCDGYRKQYPSLKIIAPYSNA